MSIEERLIGLSQQVLRNIQDITLEQQFRTMVLNVANLPHCLAAFRTHNHSFLFVYTTTMIKALQSDSFCVVSQTRSEQNILSLVDNSPTNAKIGVYSQLLGTLTQTIIAQRPAYITNSMVDLMGLTLKKLLEQNNSFACLQALIDYFVPHYKLNENFITETQTSGVFAIQDVPLGSLQLQSFQLLLRVLTSMCEFVLQINQAVSYYQYRKCVYIFRNQYLAYLLQFGLDFFISLFRSNSSAAQPFLTCLTPLLEAVWMYPFAMSLHQSDVDEDVGQAITGSYGSDVYFPNYFRPVLSNQLILNCLFGYLKFMLSSNKAYEQLRQPLNGTIKILGRMCCASPYSFRNEEEKTTGRSFAAQLLRFLCTQFKFTDSYYLYGILEVFAKVMTMGDKHLTEHRMNLVEPMNSFISQVVTSCIVSVEQGKKSPLSKAFNLITILNQIVRERGSSIELSICLGQFQNILETTLMRLLGAEADQIVKAFGCNVEGEIQCYSELFSSMVEVVQLNLEKNLKIISELQLSQLSGSAVVIWFHFCSQLLPKTQGQALQVRIILKYYQLAVQRTDLLACLRYARTLAECVLGQLRDNQPITPLWLGLVQQRPSLSFASFMQEVITLCQNNFNRSNITLLRYSLEFFRMVFTSLKRADDSQFDVYYEVVKHIVRNIQNTIFAVPKYFKVRRQLFGIIAVVFLNEPKIDFIYQIHDLLLNGLQNSPQGLLRYMLDMTGMVEQIDRHQCFQIVSELAIKHLTVLFRQLLPTQDHLQAFLSHDYNLSAFCNMVLAFIADINRKLYFTTHTPLPSDMHALFLPYMDYITRKVRPLPLNYPKIMEKMITLNPLATLVDISSTPKQLKSNNLVAYQSLMRVYFEHIQRVDNIGWMFPLIEENLQFMSCWWQQAIFRGIKPEVNWTLIVEARIWSTPRQMETLAKLLFYVGMFEPKYWNVQGFSSERDFINHFVKSYS